MDEVTLLLLGLLIAAALVLIEERYRKLVLRATFGLCTAVAAGLLLWFLRVDIGSDTIDFLAVSIGTFVGSRILDLSG